MALLFFFFEIPSAIKKTLPEKPGMSLLPLFRSFSGLISPAVPQLYDIMYLRLRLS